MKRVLSLFAGIGGFDLGLERTGGFKTVAFCEIDPFCQRVLAKHWPEVPCYDDVRDLTANTLARDGIAVDVIVGGFPCQDISKQGLGAGIDGGRSGLWAEYCRLIGELRPLYVIVENVSALLSRGFDRVLGDLAKVGYDAWWRCIRASDIGFRHGRDRVWIVAYPECRGISFGRRIAAASEALLQSVRVYGHVSSCLSQQADSMVDFLRPSLGFRIPPESKDKPRLARVSYGLSSVVGEIAGYGNAVVPQIPEMIGRAILTAESSAKNATTVLR